MNKKVLIFVEDGSFTYDNRVIRETKALATEGWDITVICPDSKEQVSMQHVKFVRIAPSKRVFGDFQFSRFKPSKMVRAIRRADIVFSQTIGPIGGTGLFMAQMFRKKTVSFIHSIDWELFTKAVDKNFSKMRMAPGFSLNLKYFV